MSDEARKEQRTEEIKELGSVDLEGNANRHKVKLLTIIGLRDMRRCPVMPSQRSMSICSLCWRR